jgi:hypothetical protein
LSQQVSAITFFFDAVDTVVSPRFAVIFLIERFNQFNLFIAKLDAVFEA